MKTRVKQQHYENTTHDYIKEEVSGEENNLYTEDEQESNSNNNINNH